MRKIVHQLLQIGRRSWMSITSAKKSNGKETVRAMGNRPEPNTSPEGTGGPDAREWAFLSHRFAVAQPPGQEFETLLPPSTPPPAGTITGRLALDFRLRLIDAYRMRQRESAPPAGFAAPEAPVPPPANNWIPIGPSILRRGQGLGRPAVSGRVAGLAIAPGGNRIYVASANGGVWRSDDAGLSWLSTMESFDLNPLQAASDTLACGAIAIDPSHPDRVYVGTGEGNNGVYFGVGPIRSDDGGTNWVTETATPPLAGRSFFALAADPGNAERVVAGTNNGVYRREPGGGGNQWIQKALPGAGDSRVTGVAASRSGSTTTFYVAPWRGPVYSSPDGSTWTPLGTNFPTANVGRIGLAVAPSDPTVLYALVARQDNNLLLGVFRLDTSDNQWRQISNGPADLFGPSAPGQGNYDLAITVDPNNPNLIYLGGSTRSASAGGDTEWVAAINRCPVTVSGSGAGRTYSMTPVAIGNTAHADVHDLQFTPGDSNKLYVGCDGGVFFTDNAKGSPGATSFQQRNVGLATLTLNHLGIHPSSDAVLFCGGQDSGTLRYTGEEAWLHSAPGDGGFAVVNSTNPYRVLRTYIRGVIDRAADGGRDYPSWAGVNVFPDPPPESVEFYAPIAGLPNPANATEANLIAFGSIRTWLSTGFGGGWQSIPTNSLATDQLNGNITALAWASSTKLYVGTVAGGVYRFTKTGVSWGPNPPAQLTPALPLTGVPVTGIAVDPADPSGNSVYITLGGTGDYRHVWHYNGTIWSAASGPPPPSTSGLLDVQHNAIVVDPANTNTLFAAADIGIWQSTDGGSTWSVFSSGLPDAAVLDLKLHPTQRILWASTYGRGVYERTLQATTNAVELYIRDTQLDTGRVPSVDGLPDPTRSNGTANGTVNHRNGPDIQVDMLSSAGTFKTPSSQINFYQFVDIVTDHGLALTPPVSQVGTVNPSSGTIHNRVYVQIHNRGVTPANGVRVMLLLAKSTPTPALPAGYATNVQNGTPINTTDWKTVGFATLNNLRVGFPQVASFDLASSMLPPPASLAGNNQYCVLALVHASSDPFAVTDTNVDTLALASRHATVKDITVVAYVGPIPPATSSSSSHVGSSSSSHPSSSSSSPGSSSSSSPGSSSSSHVSSSSSSGASSSSSTPVSSSSSSRGSSSSSSGGSSSSHVSSSSSSRGSSSSSSPGSSSSSGGSSSSSHVSSSSSTISSSSSQGSSSSSLAGSSSSSGPVSSSSSTRGGSSSSTRASSSSSSGGSSSSAVGSSSSSVPSSSSSTTSSSSSTAPSSSSSVPSGSSSSGGSSSSTAPSSSSSGAISSSSTVASSSSSVGTSSSSSGGGGSSSSAAPSSSSSAVGSSSSGGTPSSSSTVPSSSSASIASSSSSVSPSSSSTALSSSSALPSSSSSVPSSSSSAAPSSSSSAPSSSSSAGAAGSSSSSGGPVQPTAISGMPRSIAAPQGVGLQPQVSDLFDLGSDRWQATASAFSLAQRLEPHLLQPSLAAVDMGPAIATDARQGPRSRLLIAVNRSGAAQTVLADLRPYRYANGRAATLYHVAGATLTVEMVTDTDVAEVTLAPGETVVWLWLDPATSSPSPPSIRFTRPLPNSNVVGVVPVVVEAMAPASIERVDFFADGAPIGTVRPPGPLESSWDSGSAQGDVWHGLSAVVYDRANGSSEARLAVRVEHPPLSFQYRQDLWSLVAALASSPLYVLGGSGIRRLAPDTPVSGRVLAAYRQITDGLAALATLPPGPLNQPPLAAHLDAFSSIIAGLSQLRTLGQQDGG